MYWGTFYEGNITVEWYCEREYEKYVIKTRKVRRLL
jgi:hypothetical protein